MLATVKGDIHDIGKNIVKVLLENYGYTVIDLGKDVPCEEVVRAALEQGKACGIVRAYDDNSEIYGGNHQAVERKRIGM